MSDPVSKEEYARRRKLWTDALRSGEYQQGKGCLCHVPEQGVPTFCCLGVACEVAIKNGVEVETRIAFNFKRYGGLSSYVPEQVKEWLGLASDCGYYGARNLDQYFDHALYRDNDTYSKPFVVLADIIESNPKGLWAEGTF